MDEPNRFRSTTLYMIDRSNKVIRTASDDDEHSEIAFQRAGKQARRWPTSGFTQSSPIMSSSKITHIINLAGPSDCCTRYRHFVEYGFAHCPFSFVLMHPTGNAASMANIAAFINRKVFLLARLPGGAWQMRAKSGSGVAFPRARSLAYK